MKTNYLSEEQVSSIRAWAKGAKENQEQINVVLNNIKKQLKGDRLSNKVARSIDANFALFKNKLFPNAMPHYRKNGSSTIIVCDWVEQKTLKSMNVAFSEFRYIKGDVREDATKLPECVGHITRDIEKPERVTIVYPSGFEKEVDAVDKEGKTITKPVATNLVPHEKSAWGYTDVVIDAFIEAADELMGMIERGELK